MRKLTLVFTGVLIFTIVTYGGYNFLKIDSATSHPKDLTTNELKEKYIKGVNMKAVRQAGKKGPMKAYEELIDGYSINLDKFHEDYEHLTLAERQIQIKKAIGKIQRDPEILRKNFQVLKEILQHTDKLSNRDTCKIFSRFAKAMNEIKLQRLDLKDTEKFNEVESFLVKNITHLANSCVEEMKFGRFLGEWSLSSIYNHKPSKNHLDKEIFSEIVKATIEAFKRAIEQIENEIESTEDSNRRSKLEEKIKTHQKFLKRYEKSLKN